LRKRDGRNKMMSSLPETRRTPKQNKTMEMIRLMLYFLAGLLAVAWLGATVIGMVLLGTPA
jgi:hypothetical protein